MKEDGEDYIREAVAEGWLDRETVAEKFIDGDYEYFDVTIRCYLLGQAISAVLDEMDADIFQDEEEEEEEAAEIVAG